MKTISYDQKTYDVIESLEFDDGNIFQKVRFESGHYGIVFVVPDSNVYDVILVGTDKKDTYVNVFMEFARTNTAVLNGLPDTIDEVELHVHLNGKYSEVFKQTVSKEQSDDLIERLKIANEIIDLERNGHDKANTVLLAVLAFTIVVNVFCCLYMLWK